jgi:tetratricopeptide (TPR) repeat protein
MTKRALVSEDVLNCKTRANMFRVRRFISHARTITKGSQRLYYAPKLYQDSSLSHELENDLHKIYYGNYSPAESKIEKVLLENPDNRTVLYVVGTYFQQKGIYNRAISLWEKLNTLASSAEICTRLGNLYHMTHDYVQAEQSYRNAIKIEHFYTMAHFGLAILLMQIKGREYEAEKHFNVALRHNVTAKQDVSTLRASRMQGQYKDYMREIMKNNSTIQERLNKEETYSVVNDGNSMHENVVNPVSTIRFQEHFPEGEQYMSVVKGRGDIVAQNETVLIAESAKIAIDVDSVEAGVVIRKKSSTKYSITVQSETYYRTSSSN